MVNPGGNYSFRSCSPESIEIIGVNVRGRKINTGSGGSKVIEKVVWGKIVLGRMRKEEKK